MAPNEAYRARNLALRAGFPSLEASRALVPPTAVTIAAQAKALNTSHTIEDIPDGLGARLHWLGERSATKVLLFLHGGGYALGPLDGHVIFPYKSLEKAGAGNEAILAFLEYSLSDVAGFPTQMIQATECLRLILSQGYKPSDIIVAGDSAGGNLALALLSNVLHPYTKTQPLVLSEPLRGLLLISPWVSCDTDTQSYKDNAETDVAPISVLEEFAGAFVQPGNRNSWSEPYLGDASWWKKAPVSKVLVVCGGAEMFRDHILKVGQDLISAGVNSRTVVCEGQIHVECILDAQTGLEPRSMSEEIWQWLKGVL